MSLPHCGACPHTPGTWCFPCVQEEWERREIEVSTLRAELDAAKARIAALEEERGGINPRMVLRDLKTICEGLTGIPCPDHHALDCTGVIAERVAKLQDMLMRKQNAIDRAWGLYKHGAAALVKESTLQAQQAQCPRQPSNPNTGHEVGMARGQEIGGTPQTDPVDEFFAAGGNALSRLFGGRNFVGTNSSEISNASTPKPSAETDGTLARRLVDQLASALSGHFNGCAMLNTKSAMDRIAAEARGGGK
jgi:hypothetical protein